MGQRRRKIAYVHILARRHQSSETVARIRQESVLRRFARKQAQERLMFLFMIATAYLYSHGVVIYTYHMGQGKEQYMVGAGSEFNFH